eukprot:TRINITY_DN620_c0_g3_i1.p1 TRINITY_DN620_c0_g3~~TRINITY_DN620_c0_g3_i1.p1  ORF type:complete len:428 (-),score=71.43 TRINITY_DN620_c0_g3_i1:2012-3295(-)
MTTIEEAPSTQEPEQDEDPYHVYTLRRPNERASSVVPQLPKQPEMAETRLRYRRIPAAARSGSFGSLGNHFPARFQFPTRRSLLESLTSDDESAVSFALSQKPRPKIARKRRRRVRATKGRFPSPDSILQDFAISDDDSVDGEDDDDDDDDVEEEEQVALGKEGKKTNTKLSPKPSPPRIVYSKSGKPPMLRKGSKKAISPPTKVNRSQTPSSSSAFPSAPAPIASPASRSADEISSGPTVVTGKTSLRASKSADSAQMSRQVAKIPPVHERPKNVIPTVLDPARTSAVPVTIVPPQAMSEEQRQNFVLMPEEPVLVTRGGRSDGGTKKKKNHRKKADKGHSKKKESRRRGEAKEEGRGSTNVTIEERKDRDELGGLRDKELSVSFAHPRYTAEQAAAAKPLNAVQRLLHMLAFVRLGSVRRSGHRR